MHWLEILEQLRKEQTEEYQRPQLELPLPYYDDRYERTPPVEEQPRAESRVIIIDMFDPENNYDITGENVK